MDPQHIGKRLAVLLGSIGVAAAVIGAASFALFTSAAAQSQANFAAGTVTLENTGAITCTIPSNLEPGDSTTGYPNGLGAQNYPPCMYSVQYKGSLPAWVALDTSISSTAGTDSAACGGTCSPLYNPPNNNSLNVLLCGAQPPSTGATVFWEETVCTDSGAPTGYGIGADQTLTYPAAYSYTVPNPVRDVCTGQSGQPSSCASSGGTGAVTNNWTYDLTLDFFLPLMAGNQYQGGSATVTMTMHAVQASNNALKTCTFSTISDPYGSGQPFWYLGKEYHNQGLNYPEPDQPLNGWGQSPSTGTCPSGLQPFFHPYT